MATENLSIRDYKVLCDAGERTKEKAITFIKSLSREELEDSFLNDYLFEEQPLYCEEDEDATGFE